MSAWPDQICSECIGETAGVINFAERVKQTQLTIEARYGKREVTPQPPAQIPKPLPAPVPVPLPTADFSQLVTDETVYEIQYMEDGAELEEDDMNLCSLVVDLKQAERTTSADARDRRSNKRRSASAATKKEAVDYSAQENRREEEEEEEEPEMPSPNDWRKTATSATSADSVTEMLREYGVLSCKLCPKADQLADFKSMREHNEKTHKLKGVFCCEISFPSRVRLVDHIQLHLNPDGSECVICCKTFKNAATLKRHYTDQHNGMDTKCKSCKFACKGPKALKRHELTHTPLTERPIKCKQCDFTFNFQSQLTTHIAAKHSVGKESHLCDICEKSFSTKGNLTIHYRSLHEDKKDMCKQCGKYVKRLTKHLTVCGQKLDLKCPHCPNLHPNMHALKTHIKRIHEKDESKLKCPHCEKVLSRPSHLKVSGGES